MPKFDYLKVQPGQVIRSSWANDLVDAIEMVSEDGAVTYEGYILNNLIPEADLAINIGAETKRIKTIFAGYGYFTYGIFPHTFLLGLQQDYLAPALTDIFDPDLLVEFSGIVRVKAELEYESYVYLLWTPASTQIAQLALLNDGNPVKPGVWKEMDFTATKGDKVNVRVSKTERVTIAVYNIPE